MRKKIKERRNTFITDMFYPILNNHALKGRHKGFRSINIGGDLRVIYKEISPGKVLFADIDNHNNLYK